MSRCLMTDSELREYLRVLEGPSPLLFSFKVVMSVISTTVLVFALYGIFSCFATQAEEERPVWTWECRESRCEKVAAGEGEAQSLGACRLSCDPWATLWPRPRGGLQRTPGRLLALNPYSVSVEAAGRDLQPGVRQLLQEAGRIFHRKVERKARTGAKLRSAGERRSLFVTLTVSDGQTRSFHTDTSEAYSLSISEVTAGRVNAAVTADTFFGARHALETLYQLIVYDDINKQLLLLSEINLSDSPAFPHRAIALDTARSYFSVASIKRTIDAMAANKLNTFHWHITDSHSFPFVSETFPKLSQYGAYSPEKVYTPDDIKSVVEYARVRGVRIIPEFDAPAHVGEGWQWVGDNATVCFKADPWSQYCVEPPCGQLNPTSEKMYQVLAGIYKDMLNVFDSDVFHMGGDEVNMNCWNTSEVITDWMDANGIPRTEEGLHELWDRFQSRAYSLLAEANGKKELPVILWTSTLTDVAHVDKYLDNKRYIIQIWTRGTDLVIPELIRKGFRVIFSNYDALYFDCGFGAWIGSGNNWCSPYIGWQKVYDNNVWDLLSAFGIDVGEGSEARKLVLGSEAALWSEQADEFALDGRLWPRAAALAERLWTDPVEGWMSAEHRFLIQRQRLVDEGIAADTIEPEWCLQNQGHCYA
ncbi:chitooligosaccharidolytic beta-N-acetylglucosaminidase isoform X4 [Schistocerca gregaria]|uniref:chitooligosaccharidolytic beta-N-acetylglucosaminidase isoform X4 n=1 Tax=Schistocerca gregaria TaxID=7010 RepID=UPI00211DB98C|nr:chitooligosaccharidolytic beta-N-acetylglucosaminidase isoform X4 [Schistocerca gregaria]